MSGVLRIGSRGSKLALIQSEWVRDQLLALHPDLRIEIEVIHTKGDRLLDAPLAKIGDKGLFTKELEAAMLTGHTDLAVHSAKDMPTEIPEGLALVAFTRREDVRDVFVAGLRPAGDAPPAGPRSVADLPPRARVGSSSLRRRSQLLALRPDLDLVDIRGNVQTRLRKVDEQDMAGTILAAAGLARLERPELAAFAFAFEEMLPAVGQGSLAIEARADDARVAQLVQPLVHRPSALAVRAERSLMRALQGGCQVPIAALAELVDDDGREQLRLRAYVGSVDGRQAVRGELTGADPEELGRVLAERLQQAGADAILAVVRAQAAGVPEADLPNGAGGPPDASSVGPVFDD
jgi:hydroxymethylbilane synthase